MTEIRLDSPTHADHLALFEQAISSVEEVCSQLDAADWDRPTDLPGWSVKDNLSHLSSYEAIAAGLAQPADVDVSHLTHFKTDEALAPANEREVEARRPLPPSAVLDEFRSATSARLKHLGALDDAGWESDVSRFAFGEAPTAAVLPIRVMDVFFHEQDIRRAAGRPGHLDGAVARFAFHRLSTLAFPRVVAKTAGAPDGSVVTWEVGPPGRVVAVESRDGRGSLVEPPATPDVRITSDFETFLCLLGGRRTPERAKADGRLTVEGAPDLAERVIGALVVIP